VRTASTVSSRPTDVIEVEHLSKSYGRRRGVTNLTFSVTAGEIFGYLGPNGAGKTTTIRALLDFIRPTSGRARIFGLDSRDDPVEIHRLVGYLPGEFGLYDRLTGLEYLTFLGSLRGGFDEPAVRELSERLDLDLAVRINALSHGNRQKLGLMQAFAHRPRLVILDEPTQGLDPLMQQVFYRLLHEARDEGRTVFLSSHVLPEIERVCDRVGIIRDGRLAAIEDVGDLRLKQVRILHFRFAGPPRPDLFAGTPGVAEVEAIGDQVRLTVTGPVDAVVKRAARFEVVDLVSHEPSLEDVFVTFYGGRDDAQ
jgi:ABC-2 type transport system ATP-binding protein